MCKSYDNSGFTCLAYEDLAKYAVRRRASISRVANSMNQTHSSMIYPAGTRGEVSPRNDGNRQQQLEATAGATALILPDAGVCRQWVGATADEGSRELPQPGQGHSACPRAQTGCTRGPPSVPLGTVIPRLFSCILVFLTLVLKTGFLIPSNPNFQPQNVKHPIPRAVKL